MGYDIKLQSDSKRQGRGYAIKRGNSIYKSSVYRSIKVTPSQCYVTKVATETKKGARTLIVLLP